ncbi:YccT family protein [Rahnella sp. PCH160]|uniref:YccT family protein n=1 Tax=Rahnella sp. PCH160 TaxID=3447928 RepID=UPI0039FCCD11
MKVCRALVAFASFSLMASASATSLKLSADVDVLVIDGKQMSGAILKGADSLELDGGQHQILFQVSKNLHPAAAQNALIYHSPALIVTFNAKGSRAVSFVLPQLSNEKDTAQFSQQMNYQLVDDQGNTLATQRDVLNLFNPGNTAGAEKLMMTYNLSGGRAAVPSFARGNTDKKSALAREVPSQISIAYLHPLWTRLAANAGIEQLLLWFKLPEKQERAS